MIKIIVIIIIKIINIIISVAKSTSVDFLTRVEEEEQFFHLRHIAQVFNSKNNIYDKKCYDVMNLLIGE